MSKPTFWQNKKKSFNLSSAEFAHRVIKVKNEENDKVPDSIIELDISIFFLFLNAFSGEIGKPTHPYSRSPLLACTI